MRVIFIEKILIVCRENRNYFVETERIGQLIFARIRFIITGFCMDRTVNCENIKGPGHEILPGKKPLSCIYIFVPFTAQVLTSSQANLILCYLSNICIINMVSKN